MVGLLGQQAGGRDQVAQTQAPGHIDGHTVDPGHAALDELLGAVAQVFGKERLALGLGVEVVPQRLHQAADDVVQVVGAGQTTHPRQQHQHGQRVQRAAAPGRALRGSGLAGRRHPVQHFHVGDGILLEREQGGSHRAARPVRLVALVVDALGFMDGPAREGVRVAQALLDGRAVGCNESHAPVELLGRAEQLAPRECDAGNRILGGRGGVAQLGSVARLQRALAL